MKKYRGKFLWAIHWENRTLQAKELYKVFSHDVTSAISVFQNNTTAAMLVLQTSPVGWELNFFVM